MGHTPHDAGDVLMRTRWAATSPATDFSGMSKGMRADIKKMLTFVSLKTGKRLPGGKTGV